MKQWMEAPARIQIMCGWVAVYSLYLLCYYNIEFHFNIKKMFLLMGRGGEPTFKTNGGKRAMMGQGKHEQVGYFESD